MTGAERRIAQPIDIWARRRVALGEPRRPSRRAAGILALDALAFRHIVVPARRTRARVNAEFNWWLLIVGLVVGAGLVWLVLADSNRRESEIAEEELPMEAAWIAATMRDAGEPIAPEVTEQVLRLHRLYLASLPPDEPRDAEADAAAGGEATDVFEAAEPSPVAIEPTAEAQPGDPVESAIRPRPRRPVTRKPGD